MLHMNMAYTWPAEVLICYFRLSIYILSILFERQTSEKQKPRKGTPTGRVLGIQGQKHFMTS